jgi:xylan 1,4-beta-xylosidase
MSMQVSNERVYVFVGKRAQRRQAFNLHERLIATLSNMFRFFVFVAWAVSLASAVADDVVEVDLSATAPFHHYWKRSFGSGHAALTLRSDWRRQMQRAVRELGLQGIRHHGIFDDDMRVVESRRQYNFSLVENSWAFQVENNVVPIVELSFMPAVLANCTWTSPVDGRVVNPGHEVCKGGMQYKNIPVPPTSFDDWHHLVKALVQHAVDRFGLVEVEKWSFECWNEMWGMPNMTVYMKLFNASSHAVKSVSPTLKIGGPATARLQDLESFVEHANDLGAAFDFVSTHMYPTDPICPTKAEWGPSCLSTDVRAAQKLVAEAGVPFYLTEYNVGCCIGYPQHDVAGAAAFAFRTIGALDGVTEILSWWTFSDVFEEETAIDKHTEFMNIYGLMTISGVPKPAWRAFQLLHEHAGDQRVNCTITESAVNLAFSPTTQSKCTFESNTNLAGFDLKATSAKTTEDCCDACRADSDCSFWTYFESNFTCRLKTSDAGRRKESRAVSGSSTAPPAPNANGTRIAALVTSKAKPRPDLKGTSVFLSFWSQNGTEAERTVALIFSGIPLDHSTVPEYATEYRIDATHANPHAQWVSMGSPRKPTQAQIAELVQASEVVPSRVRLHNDTSLTVSMGPNSAVLLVF